MVNFWLVKPDDLHPSLTDAERRINGGGPIYKLDVVRRQLQAGSVRFFTDECQTDVDKLGWDATDAWAVVQQLAARHYRNSQWCHAQNNTWLACDSYAIEDYDDGLHDPARKFELYLKFAVSNNGRLVLIVSCHPSRP